MLKRLTIELYGLRRPVMVTVCGPLPTPHSVADAVFAQARPGRLTIDVLAILAARYDGDARLSPQRAARHIARFLQREAIADRILIVAERDAGIDRWLLDDLLANPSVPPPVQSADGTSVEARGYPPASTDVCGECSGRDGRRHVWLKILGIPGHPAHDAHPATAAGYVSWWQCKYCAAWRPRKWL